MESPTAIETRARLNKIYRRTEQDVVNALIEHYVQVRKKRGTTLAHINKTIQEELARGEQ